MTGAGARTTLSPTHPAPPSRPHRAWIGVLVVTLVALVVVLPALPAGWRGVTHWSLVGASSADEYGTVRVEACKRGALLVDWTCRGRFDVNDPTAEPYPPMTDVTVVNDARFHPQGTLIDTAKMRKSHDGYLWGGEEQARTGALWAGVVLCVVAAALAVTRRRRRMRVPSALLVLGLLLLGAAHTNWPDGSSSSPPGGPAPVPAHPSASTGTG